jgi:cleavage and polyadenylation specificity factor subunit 3
MSTVDIKASGKFELSIEWVGSVTNDMIADSVIALVLGVDRSPASVKKTTSESPHHHHHHHPHPQAEPIDLPSLSILDKQEEIDIEPIESNDPTSFPLPTRLDRLIAFLDSYFGQVELIMREEIIPASESITELPSIVEDISEEEKIVEEGIEEEKNIVGQTTEEMELTEEKDVIVKEETKVGVQAPIIRVRLDDHTADVTIEDLVSL